MPEMSPAIRAGELLQVMKSAYGLSEAPRPKALVLESGEGAGNYTAQGAKRREIHIRGQ